MKHLTFLLVLISFSSFAQVKGVIKDNKGQAVPYTNVWIQDNEGGCTSDLMGKFTLPKEAKGKNLIVYACGFEIKEIEAANATEIVLTPISLEKTEKTTDKKGNVIIVTGAYNEKEIKSFFNTTKSPVIWAKYFEPLKTREENLYLKNILVFVQNTKEDAKIRVRLFSVNNNGSPGSEMGNEDLIKTIPKGIKNVEINLEKYNIRFPKEGIFVAIEWLFIKENYIVQETIKDKNGKEYEGYESFMPVIGMYPSEEANTWEFAGKWIRRAKIPKGDKGLFSEKYPEPAISLTLTN